MAILVLPETCTSPHIFYLDQRALTQITHTWEFLRRLTSQGGEFYLL